MRMSRNFRRTITVTLTETWTIVWAAEQGPEPADYQEQQNEATHMNGTCIVQVESDSGEPQARQLRSDSADDSRTSGTPTRSEDALKRAGVRRPTRRTQSEVGE
jgi:hypothetical protein